MRYFVKDLNDSQNNKEIKKACRHIIFQIEMVPKGLERYYIAT